jgi:hypothetical protein
LDFIRTLFKEYAQAGLTDETDREIAISGLLQRMDRAFSSEHRYGIFKCFISRLLLWRVLGTADGIKVDNGQLPSWSWMKYNQIEFFPAGEIKILKRSIKFDSGAELLAPIRRLQNCEIKPRGSDHVIQGGDSYDVGELWFDGQASMTAKDCIVIGMQDSDECFILLVLKDGHHHYRRIGAGHVKAYCLSKTWNQGTIT